MKLKSLHFPRYTAVILLLIIASSIISLNYHAPAQVAADIGNVTIYSDQTTHLRISGNNFTCPNLDADETTLTCSIEIVGERLDMQLNTSQGFGSSITGCTAQFGEKPIPCKGSYSSRYRSPAVILEDTLGMSEAQLGQLRLQHWQDQLTEAAWLRVALIAVSLLVINFAILLWQSLSKRNMELKWQTAVTSISGFVLFIVLQLSSIFILLSQGWFD